MLLEDVAFVDFTLPLGADEGGVHQNNAAYSSFQPAGDHGGSHAAHGVPIRIGFFRPSARMSSQTSSAWSSYRYPLAGTLERPWPRASGSMTSKPPPRARTKGDQTAPLPIRP